MQDNLFFATQNDSCNAISVIIDNTCKSCYNGNDVAIAGIICGAGVLICLMATIILLRKLENDIKLAENEEKERTKKHDWEKEKETTDRNNQIQDSVFKKKHEYQKELLEYIKERGGLMKNEERDKYHEYVRELLDCLKKKCELTNDEDKNKFQEYQDQIKDILKNWKDFEDNNSFVSKVEEYINKLT